MGRPRKPTALKLVAGTDRADRRNGQEPEPALLDNLEPPAHLEPRSAVVWRELAPMLRRLRVLTEADVVAFEMLCDAVADYRYARTERGDVFVTKSPRTGAEMLSQWLVAGSVASKRAEAFMGKFGLDPASRSRIMINPQAGLFDTPPETGPGRFFGARQ